jgi:hypothetical protein
MRSSIRANKRGLLLDSTFSPGVKDKQEMSLSLRTQGKYGRGSKELNAMHGKNSLNA